LSNQNEQFKPIQAMTTTTQTITFGELTQGTVINFNRSVTADDTNYVVLRQYEDKWGFFTEVLNLSTFEKDQFTQHTIVQNFWSIVKSN
jgi:dTDP-4-dehydrorhamnose 3,5-epimerase-like enzyme